MVIRSRRRWLCPSDRHSESFIGHRQRNAFNQALMLVRVFYVLLLFFSFSIAIALWPEWSRLSELQPLWVVYWLRLFSPRVAADVLVLGTFVIGLVSLVLPQIRFVRILVFVTFLMLVGMANSMGKINHSFHGLLAPAFMFIFLPAKWSTLENSVSRKQCFLQVFWGAQLLLLCFYSMSGVMKCFGIIQQMATGEMNALHPYAMSYQIADRLLQTNSDSILGPFIIRYPYWGWLPYIAAIYFETFAIIASFRPTLHRVWGVCLILFHIATWLTMSIPFPPAPVVLGILLVISPFQPQQLSISHALSDVPLFGDLGRLILKLKEDFSFTVRYN